MTWTQQPRRHWCRWRGTPVSGCVIHDAARDHARGIAQTEAYLVSRRERKKVEMLFAHLKRILKLDRLRLRGPCGAHDEFLLAATAQNLRKLAKLIPAPVSLAAAWAAQAPEIQSAWAAPKLARCRVFQRNRG